MFLNYVYIKFTPFHVKSCLILIHPTFYLQNHDPKHPPSKKQRLDLDDAVVVDEELIERDANLKELVIRLEKTMEKMKRRQEVIEGKLDGLIAQLNSAGGCDVSVKKSLTKNLS